GSQRTSTSNISAMPGAPHQIESLREPDLARSAQGQSRRRRALKAALEQIILARIREGISVQKGIRTKIAELPVPLRHQDQSSFSCRWIESVGDSARVSVRSCA